jgi:hypothetical protein
MPRGFPFLDGGTFVFLRLSFGGCLPCHFLFLVIPDIRGVRACSGNDSYDPGPMSKQSFESLHWEH